MLIALSAVVIGQDEAGRLYWGDAEEFPYYNQMSPAERIYHASRRMLIEAEEAEAFLKELKEVSLDAQPLELPPHNLVVIMGESLCRNYMSLYGYPLPTTPRLDALMVEGNMVKYTNAISPDAHTGGAISRVLTFYSLDDPGEWYQYPTLPLLMDKAGYATYWLSAQESSGLWIQSVVAVANTSQDVHFVQPRTTRDWWETRPLYDEEVLPHLRSFRDLPEGGGSLFEVVHLMGSHPTFHRRFPEHYRPFSPEQLPERLSQNKDRTRTDYINSIHYNDSIVSEIIARYKDEPSIVIYLSDHGFIVYDDPSTPDQARHGTEAGGLQIPLLVYVSPSMQTLFPWMLDELRVNKNQPIVTDFLPEAISQMMGIQSKYSNPRRGFFSSSYDTTRRQKYLGWAEEQASEL